MAWLLLKAASQALPFQRVFPMSESRYSENFSAPVRNFVAGVWRDAASGARFVKHAPATGEVLTEVAHSAAADVDTAVAAARAQFDGGEWSRFSGAARGRLLYALADLLERDAEHFVRLLAVEQGRPLVEMRMLDLPMSIDVLRYFAGWADKLEGRQIPTGGFMGRPTLNYTTREPVGVAALIVPWNAPLMIGLWKLAPALAAGCTVVLKPSEDAPCALSALMDRVAEAGFPPGVVNLVNGMGETGAALVAHPGVDKVSFTGSTAVGRLIAREAAPRFKRLTLELGGKAPQILCADADLAAAIPGVAMGLFVNQGQTCAAGTRVLVHRARYDETVAALAAAAKATTLGDPLDADTRMGALINAKQRDRVQALIESGLAEGACRVAGDEAVPEQGFFLRPTVFADGRSEMRLMREEIFGPVGIVVPFDSDEEAVRLANDTPFGLSASLWTRDLARAHTLAARLRFGAVAINGWSPLDARLPWGGFGDSGIGRDLSRCALDAYTEEKVVSLVL
jgi:betaine-aldehyde dehydrogenase/succinate-semialdehyde dehydrogenase/glutarate-semialdehyde dehydrogenase